MSRIGHALAVVAGIVFEASALCKDVQPIELNSSFAKCYKNAKWAKETGAKKHPEYYVNFSVNENSSVTDFQCVLWRLSIDGIDANGTEGHGCAQPCTDYTSKCAEIVSNPIAARDTPIANENPKLLGFPWWSWLMIIAGIAFILAAVAFAFMGQKNRPQKKKRALKKPAPKVGPSVASPSVVPAPVTTTSVSMPVYHAAPMVQYASPVTTAAPVIRGPPTVVTTAAPVYAAQANSVIYAAPTGAVLAPGSAIMPTFSTYATSQ